MDNNDNYLILYFKKDLKMYLAHKSGMKVHILCLTS